jgi:hypothetical protein
MYFKIQNPEAFYLNFLVEELSTNLAYTYRI